MATAGGVVLNFIGIDPIRALFWAAVINGVVAVPIMAGMMLLATDPRVLGEFAVRRGLKVAGWAGDGDDGRSGGGYADALSLPWGRLRSRRPAISPPGGAGRL